MEQHYLQLSDLERSFQLESTS